MKAPDRPLQVALTTVLAPVSWGTTYVTVTEFLPAGRPLFVAAMRVLPAGLVLVLAGRLVSRWRPRGRDWLHTLTLATFNFGLFFPLLVVAVYRLPGGVAAAAGGLQPILVAALTGWSTGRRPRRLDIVIGAIAATGVALVVVRPGAGIDPVGVLAAIGANVSFAIGVVLTKRFPVPPNRIAATGWQLLVGGAAIVPLTLLLEGVPAELSGRNGLGFGYLSLVGTALAFVLWFSGIQRLPTAAPPLLGLAAPVTGAALGWIMLDQSLSPVQLVGMAITISAIAYGATAGSRVPVAPISVRRPRPSAPNKSRPNGPDAARTVGTSPSYAAARTSRASTRDHEPLRPVALSADPLAPPVTPPGPVRSRRGRSSVGRCRLPARR